MPHWDYIVQPFCGCRFKRYNSILDQFRLLIVRGNGLDPKRSFPLTCFISNTFAALLLIRAEKDLDLILLCNCTTEKRMVTPLPVPDHYFIRFSVHLLVHPTVPPVALIRRNLKSLSSMSSPWLHLLSLLRVRSHH